MSKKSIMQEGRTTFMNHNFSFFSVLIVLLALVSKGTRVFGFAPTIFVPFQQEAPSNNIVSGFPSTQSKLSTRLNRLFGDEIKSSRLLAQSNENSESTKSSPRVKFSDNDFNNDDGDSSSSLANPLDQFLTLIASDAFSIVFGTIGLLAVVVYRWNLVLAVDAGRAAAEALTYQTRTDLLAVFASGSVLLNGVTKLDVTTALAESVVLEGTALPKPEQIGNDDLTGGGKGNKQNWALESLLAATPAKTAVLITDTEDRWSISYRAGVIPSSPSSLLIPEKTPILERVGSPENTKETYLPTLQNLPGRTELTYLPDNTQMAVLIPIQPSSSLSSSNNNKKNSVLVLGGNTAKSFSPRDIAWSRIVAEKLGEDL